MIGYQKDGKTYACTAYQPFGASTSPLPYSATAPAAAMRPDSGPLFPSDGSVLSLPRPAAAEAPSAAPVKELQSAADFTAKYLSGFRAEGAPASAPSITDELFAEYADYGMAPSPGGYGSSGTQTHSQPVMSHLFIVGCMHNAPLHPRICQFQIIYDRIRLIISLCPGPHYM